MQERILLLFDDLKVVAPDSDNARMLRRAVLPVLVIEKDGAITPVGTCFIVSAIEREALALTAKHNVEYIRRVDGGRDRHTPSTPEDCRTKPAHRRYRLKNLQMLAAYWYADESMAPCDITEAWSDDGEHDVAVLLLRIREQFDATFTHHLTIDSNGPEPGTRVTGIGCPALTVANQTADDTEITGRASLTIPINAVEGTITGRHDLTGHHLVKAPSVEIDCQFDAGMSGGPIFIEQPDGTVVATQGLVEIYAAAGFFRTFSADLCRRAPDISNARRSARSVSLPVFRCSPLLGR